MWKSFRVQLPVTVISLVLLSNIIVSQIIMHYYNKALVDTSIKEAEHIALHLSLELEDKILTNNFISIQKQIDDLRLNNQSIGYLFIIKDNRVIAHTFVNGFPLDLLGVNAPVDNSHFNLKKIITKQGDRYLDIAMPIFDGKAGILRLGYSEIIYRKAINQLHFTTFFMILGVICLALVLSFLLIKRFIKPLSILTKTVENINEDALPKSIRINGGFEIKKLSDAFNLMMEWLREYTDRLKNTAKTLEEKNIEMDRRYQQTKVSLEITREIIALTDLKEVFGFLINKMQDVIVCKRMLPLVFSRDHDRFFLYKDEGIQTIEAPNVEPIITFLNPLTQIEFFGQNEIPLVDPQLQKAERVGILPLRYKDKLIGAMFVACPGDCRCMTGELETIHLILNLSAGAIFRAVSHEDDFNELKSIIGVKSSYCSLVGKDPKMQVMYKLIEDVAPSDATVLIQGESGTGKELTAQAIHQKSPRNQSPFIVINCSAYPETLLESELFGYEKGAFTGASQQKAGRFELADGGTVFLDEIGEISSSAQVKLLRVLQSRKFERLGGQKTIEVDIRIIAATNKNLIEDVKNARFREDLFYRLNVIPIILPTLRERRNDVPLLARHFLNRFIVVQNKPAIKDFSAEAMRALLDYLWPGNVRELENSVEHAVVLSKTSLIQENDLPSIIISATQMQAHLKENDTLEHSERKHLIEILEATNWSKAEAARRLGIGRSTLYLKLKKFNIKNPA